MITHAYLKYAMALLMVENDLSRENDVTFSHIKREIVKGFNTFYVKPVENYAGKEIVRYDFVNNKNKTEQFVFLSPNAISKQDKASNLYNAVKKICDLAIDLNLEKENKVVQAQIPTVGEFCSFSDKIGRGNPKASNLDICLGLITSTTPLKPCLQYISGSKENENVCLIPDLDIPELIDFIKLFKRLRIQRLSDLMIGKVDIIKGKKNDTYKPKRPKLFSGNFPNAPRSSALGIIALLGAIGEMVKEQYVSELALRVLESFKGHNFYIFKYGDAQVFNFNHHVIDLAEKSHLRSVVDSLYYVTLYNYGKRTSEKEELNSEDSVNKNQIEERRKKQRKIEFQKFDLFASRFLQLFNKPTFKDFLAFRAEYPRELEILFKTYFIQMEHINQEIVLSAKELGRWLNSVAYRVASAEIKDNSKQDKERRREIKAKVLVELESSIFASKSADALIAHTIARAGRLSYDDAPAEASLFIEKTISGEVSLEQAKNLLIAFSRLRSTVHKSDSVTTEDLEDLSEEESNSNYSNI